MLCIASPIWKSLVPLFTAKVSCARCGSSGRSTVVAGAAANVSAGATALVAMSAAAGATTLAAMSVATGALAAGGISAGGAVGAASCILGSDAGAGWRCCFILGCGLAGELGKGCSFATRGGSADLSCGSRMLGHQMNQPCNSSDMAMANAMRRDGVDSNAVTVRCSGR